MFDGAKMLMAGYRLFKDPSRLDQVLDVAAQLTQSGSPKVANITREVLPPALRRCFDEKYLIQWDLPALAACPAGSLGRAVFDHCTAYGIDPATFPTRPMDSAVGYVMAHVENTHDVWHVVAGFGSDAVGELGLQAFAMAQFPNLLGSFILGVAHLHAFKNERSDYPRLMDEIARGWIMGKRAKSLLGTQWDRLFHVPLSVVQDMFHVHDTDIRRLLRAGDQDFEARTAIAA